MRVNARAAGAGTGDQRRDAPLELAVGLALAVGQRRAVEDLAREGHDPVVCRLPHDDAPQKACPTTP